MTDVEGPRRMIRAGALAAAVGVSAVLAVNAILGEVRMVESNSMVPTLDPGERVLVAKASVDRWALERGTVVVFDGADLWTGADDPAGSVFVKRVVGVGGDRITCCTDDGRLLANGSPLAEPYLAAGMRSDQQAFDVILAPHHYWMLGDNRVGSADSRAHLGDPGGGSIPASRIIGTVEAVVWPPGSVRRMEGSDE